MVILQVCGCYLVCFLDQTPILVGLWFGEDQKTNTLRKHMLKKDAICLQISLPTPHSVVNTIGRTYICIQSRIHQTCTSGELPVINQNPNQRTTNPQSTFRWCSIPNMLMQLKSRRANSNKQKSERGNYRNQAYLSFTRLENLTSPL